MFDNKRGRKGALLAIAIFFVIVIGTALTNGWLVPFLAFALLLAFIAIVGYTLAAD